MNSWKSTLYDVILGVILGVSGLIAGAFLTNVFSDDYHLVVKGSLAGFGVAEFVACVIYVVKAK